MSEAANNIEAQAAVQVAPTTGGPQQADSALIRSALHLETLKNQVAMAAFVLVSTPHDKASVELWMRNVQVELNAAWDAYAAYSAIRTCAGSA